MIEAAPIFQRFGSCAPSPLEGEGRGGGWLSDRLMDPLPQSLPSRGREAKEPEIVVLAP